MSYDLIVWKGPVTSSEDEARALVDRWHNDESGTFEPSRDVSRFYDALMQRYPALESFSDEELRSAARPTYWAVTPERSDRIVDMSFSWSVPGEVIDDVMALARDHGLVLYDPQAPYVRLPDDDDEGTPFGVHGFAWATLVGTFGALLAIVAWMLSIPILSGIIVVVGGFLAIMAVLTLVHEGREAWRDRA
jgi:hypothetical protein